MPSNKNKAPKKSGSSLGRSLTHESNRARQRSAEAQRQEREHGTPPPKESANAASITQETPLEAFLSDAALANRSFHAEHGARVVTHAVGYVDRRRQALSDEERHERTLNEARLRVPRRPAAARRAPDRTALDRLERAAFVEWRRALAALEANELLLLTPFERNLNMWRQLWRVVERSELVVQIVDARNPLQYRCADLDVYVTEVARELGERQKTSLLLVNKADFLTVAQRRTWARYFAAHNIPFVFWSARVAAEQDEDEAEMEEDLEAAAAEAEGGETGDDADDADDDDDAEAIRVHGRRSLLNELRRRLPPLDSNDQDDDGEDDNNNNNNVARVIRRVGFVGYPNVGKSSTINALLGAKKTGVTATPGKTKHFQTLQLTADLLAVDCPGLVFPSFAMSKADMYCNGLLPIDHLRDRYPPVALLCQRIPRDVLERSYGVRLPGAAADAPSPQHLLQAHAKARGFMTGGGVPDESRAARLILKDYVAGRLLYAAPPPDAEFDAADARRAQLDAANLAALDTSATTTTATTTTTKAKPKKSKAVPRNVTYEETSEAAHIAAMSGIGRKSRGRKGKL